MTQTTPSAARSSDRPYPVRVRAVLDTPLSLGIHRWSLRVAGYTGLMTDRHPPFRFDLGGEEPSAPTDTDTAETPVPVRHAD